MKTPKIPKSDSIKELANFWESHDFTDFEDQMKRVEEPVFERGQSVKVQLERTEAKIIRKLAKSKGMQDADLIHQWIREKIQTR